MSTTIPLDRAAVIAFEHGNCVLCRRYEACPTAAAVIASHETGVLTLRDVRVTRQFGVTRLECARFDRHPAYQDGRWS